MYAYTWRMWHNTAAKYYENVENGVSRCLPCSFVKWMPYSLVKWMPYSLVKWMPCSLVKWMPCSLVKWIPCSLVKCLLYEFYPWMGCVA